MNTTWALWWLAGGLLLLALVLGSVWAAWLSGGVACLLLAVLGECVLHHTLR